MFSLHYNPSVTLARATPLAEAATLLSLCDISHRRGIALYTREACGAAPVKKSFTSLRICLVFSNVSC